MTVIRRLPHRSCTGNGGSAVEVGVLLAKTVAGRDGGRCRLGREAGNQVAKLNALLHAGDTLTRSCGRCWRLRARPTELARKRPLGAFAAIKANPARHRWGR